MEEELKNKVIELYLNGIGSTKISKILPISKSNVLKILKEKNLTRSNKHSDDFYKDFWEENGKWCGYWVCDTCFEKIKFTVNKKCLLNRNLKKKKTCKKCSLQKQIGEGNPFYGKKHKKETIEQISKTRTGKYCGDDNHMKDPEFIKKFTENLNEKWSKGVYDYLKPIFRENIIKTRLSGKLKSFNRSKAEDEIIEKLLNNDIFCEPNFLLDDKIFDIYIPKYNLFIEYNGDYWHCNPIKYSENYINKKKNKTAKEIWEYDNNKLYLAKKNGYNCEVIWETDYKKNKNIIFDIIKNYEKNNY